MTGWKWHNPAWLFLLLTIPLVIWWSVRRRRQSSVLFSSTMLVRDLRSSWTVYVKRSLLWLRALAIVLLIVGLARPQKGLQEFRVRTEGIAIQMCVDRSGSMLAMDFDLQGERVNRLDAVKRVMHDFVKGNDELAGRSDDLIGLISFGGFAEGRVPLTLDHELLVKVLDEIEVAKPIIHNGQVINRKMLREERATAIGDALALAVARLKDNQSKSKVVILLSDGENTAGEVEPPTAADMAKSFGIKIYTIGVGKTGYAPYPATSLFGSQTLQNQYVQLDEKTLRMLASKTGGQYFNANSTAALRDVYRKIDELEKTETEGRLYTEYQEWFPLFVIPGCLFVLLHLVLTTTWFHSLPS